MAAPVALAGAALALLPPVPAVLSTLLSEVAGVFGGAAEPLLGAVLAAPVGRLPVAST
nr:hypothetical protein [Nakamurella aerolata]